MKNNENMEIWRDIKGYDGEYQVSNLGRVKSLKYGKEKIMKFGTNKDNYLRVILCKNNKVKTFRVHLLVAMAFLPNPDNLPQLNHKDENPSNNNVENLEWCTISYNINYGTRNKRVSKILTNGILSMKVDQFSKKGEFIKTWPSIMQVERELGIDNSSISKCCKGKNKSAGKFIFKYHN